MESERQPDGRYLLVCAGEQRIRLHRVVQEQPYLIGEVEAFESDYVHRTQTVHINTGRWHYSGLCPLEVKLQVGQLVQAQIDPEQLYFFDTTSGLRL
jgi:hypothetical protein